MADLDEKDVQAFNELQNRLMDLSEKQKFTQQQLQASSQVMRRAVLTARELEQLEDTTPTYEAAGKAYFLTPKNKLLQNLQEQATSSSAEIKKLKESQEAFLRGRQGVEAEVRELLQNSPSLARAFASQ